MAVFSDLPLDIIDRVLMQLRDFNTLAAAIRTCKSVYDVFEAHPRSIVQAVAYNMVGPALPDALRLIPYAHNANPADHDESQSGGEPGGVPPFSRRDTDILRDNAHVAARLETLYSMSKKDRTAAASTLTDAESARFARALYTLWAVLAMLLCELSEAESARVSAAEDAHDENEDVDDDDGDEPDYIQTVVVAVRKTDAQRWLGALADRELFAVDALAAFLQEIVAWTRKAATELWGGWVATMLARPDAVLGLYMDDHARYGVHRNGFSLEDDDVHGQSPTVGWEALEDVLGAVLRKRDVADARREAERAKAVLDSTVGQHDLCHRCLNSAPLWGRTNFPLIRGALSKREICAHLRGRLPANAAESTALQAHLAARDARDGACFDWGLMFTQLCASPADAGDAGVWDADGYYCLPCVEALLQARLTAWWLARKREAGVVIRDDCWYGYACRTQTHKLEHALRLNHLCAPTRGDGYVPRAAAHGTA